MAAKAKKDTGPQAKKPRLVSGTFPKSEAGDQAPESGVEQSEGAGVEVRAEQGPTTVEQLSGEMIKLTADKAAELETNDEKYLGMADAADAAKVLPEFVKARENAEGQLEQAEVVAETSIDQQLGQAEAIQRKKNELERTAKKQKQYDPGSKDFDKAQRKIDRLTAELHELESGGTAEVAAEPQEVEAATETERATAAPEIIESEQAEEKAPDSGVRETVRPATEGLLPVKRTDRATGVTFAPAEGFARTKSGGIRVSPTRDIRPPSVAAAKRIATILGMPKPPEVVSGAAEVAQTKEIASGDFLESEEFAKASESGYEKITDYVDFLQSQSSKVAEKNPGLALSQEVIGVLRAQRQDKNPVVRSEIQSAITQYDDAARLYLRLTRRKSQAEGAKQAEEALKSAFEHIGHVAADIQAVGEMRSDRGAEQQIDDLSAQIEGLKEVQKSMQIGSREYDQNQASIEGLTKKLDELAYGGLEPVIEAAKKAPIPARTGETLQGVGDAVVINDQMSMPPDFVEAIEAAKARQDQVLEEVSEKVLEEPGSIASLTKNIGPDGAEHKPIPGEGQENEAGVGEFTDEEINEFYDKVPTFRVSAEQMTRFLSASEFEEDIELIKPYLNDPVIGPSGKELLTKMKQLLDGIMAEEQRLEGVKAQDVAGSLKQVQERRILALQEKIKSLKAEVSTLQPAFEDLAGRCRELQEAKGKGADNAQPSARIVQEPTVKPESAPSAAQEGWLMGMEEQMSEKQAGAPLEMLQHEEREMKRALKDLEQAAKKLDAEDSILKAKANMNAQALGMTWPADVAPSEAGPQPVFHEMPSEPSGIELGMDTEDARGEKQKSDFESRLKQLASLKPEEWGDVYSAMDPNFSKSQWEQLKADEKAEFQNIRKGQVENELKKIELQAKISEQRAKINAEQTRLGAEKRQARIARVSLRVAEPAPETAAAAAETDKEKSGESPTKEAKDGASLSAEGQTAIKAEHEAQSKEPPKEEDVDSIMDQYLNEEEDDILKSVAEGVPYRQQRYELVDRLITAAAAFEAAKGAEGKRVAKENLVQVLEESKALTDNIIKTKPTEKPDDSDAVGGAITKAGKWGGKKAGNLILGGLFSATVYAPKLAKFLFWDSAINLLEGMMKWSDPGGAWTQTFNSIKKWGAENTKKKE